MNNATSLFSLMRPSIKTVLVGVFTTILCIAVTVQPAYAESEADVTSDGFTAHVWYGSSGASVAVKKFTGAETQVVLPTSFSVNGTSYPANKSSNWYMLYNTTFKNNTKITKVAIPNGYDTIEVGAFSGCTSLVEVAIGDSVSYLSSSGNQGALTGCSAKTYYFKGENVSEDMVKNSGVGTDTNGNPIAGVTVWTKQGSNADKAIKALNATRPVGKQITIKYDNDPYSKNTISAKTSIAKASVSGISDKTYTGKAQTQNPVLKLSSKTLKLGTDYTIKYTNNTKVGIATITFAGKGNYTGTVNKTFKINPAWKRLAGNNALQTMEKITKEFGTAKVAIVTTNALGSEKTKPDPGYKDSLAATALAGSLSAPMLTTSRGKLEDITKSELKRMGVKTVYIVGTENEVVSAVDTQIKSLGISVKRIKDKTASMRAISCAKTQGKNISDTVIIATQNNFKDALSISSYAYATKSPILYAETNKKLSSATVNYIKQAKFKKAIIVGGPVALPANIETQLKDAGIKAANITRLAGSNQYKTSRVIAEWAIGKLKNGTGGGKNTSDFYYYASIKFQPNTKLSVNKLGVARADVNTNGWKDALAGAALCGKNKSVLLLCDDNLKSFSTNGIHAETVIKVNRTSIMYAYVFGGYLAVSNNVLNKLKTASSPVTTTLAVKSTGSSFSRKDNIDYPDQSGSNQLGRQILSL